MIEASFEMPTLAEFEQELGSPLLSFTMDQRDVMVPTGEPHCCRQVHQSYCESHVAKTLIGCEFDIRFPDGEIDRRCPVKRTFDGDVLARPRDLAAAVQSVTLLAQSTAEGAGGVLVRLEHYIWTLNLEQAFIWDQLVKQHDEDYQAALEEAEPHSGAWIEALPVLLLDPDCSQDLVQVMGRPDFRHVKAYARKVLVLPNEIGHDGEARYITSPLGGQPGDWTPPVEAILRDPQEDEA